MDKIFIKYISINILLAIITFLMFYFFRWNSLYEAYGFNSFLIIDIASVFVFLGIYLSIKLKFNKFLIIYLYCTLFKNAILLLYCYNYKPITRKLVFYLFFIYLLMMSIEILYILKLINYIDSKRQKHDKSHKC